MIRLKAALKMACCPKLSPAKLVLVFREAASYFCKNLSYLSASNFSLLKYYKEKTNCENFIIKFRETI